MALRAQLRGLLRFNPLGKPCSAVSSRYFAQSINTPVGEDGSDIVKDKFIEKIKQYYGLLAEFKKFRIVIDPDDPKAVKDFAKNIFKAYENVGIPPIVEQVDRVIAKIAARSKTVREYYERLGKFQIDRGYSDGTSNRMMLAAVDKIEKEIGRTLVSSDVEGMKLFKKETDAILEKLGLKHSDLDKYVEQAQIDHAKCLLVEMKQKAEENMDQYKKRDGLEDVHVDTKDLDFRHLIHA